MPKYLRVGKKEFPTRKCVVLGLKEGRCACRKKREGVVFGGGAICIRCKNGPEKLFSTRIPGTPIVDLLYCRDDQKTLMFSDKNLDEEWEQVFAYFFDDEGGLLLCADKYCVPTLGALFNIVGAADWPTLRRQALNIAVLFNEKLFDEILEIEKNLTDELTDVDLISDRTVDFNGRI